MQIYEKGTGFPVLLSQYKGEQARMPDESIPTGLPRGAFN